MSYLTGIQTRIVPNDEGIEVVYEDGIFSGTVKYVRYDMENRLMKGKPVYLMVNSDMGDIIEMIHQRTPLSSEDFNDINMEIRTHSRDRINLWVQGHHQK